MLLAMAAAAVLCIGIGLYPQPLYDLLPYPVDYIPYTPTHVVTQAQLVFFAAAAFAFLYRRGWYPPELRSVNVDSDVVYRKAVPSVLRAAASVAREVRERVAAPLRRRLVAASGLAIRPVQLRGWLAAAWSTGAMVWWVALLLGLYLVLALR
jgi:multicomponent Na+:H+ antiporter subunit D